jgi:cyclopropane-fatty-acyl-phospholipid synthase
MWEFYLQTGEVGFRKSGLCVFQLQLAKRIDAVPIIRDYIYLADEFSEVRRRAGAVGR